MRLEACGVLVRGEKKSLKYTEPTASCQSSHAASFLRSPAKQTVCRTFVCTKINLEINQVTLQKPLKAFHESS